MIIMKGEKKFDENEFCRELLEWFLEKILGHVPRESRGIMTKREFNRISSYPKLDKKEVKLFTAGLVAQGKIRKTKDEVIIVDEEKKT